MARPSSRTTRVRNWLVARIQPYPDTGEGWCIDCALNDGKTQIMPENSLRIHVRKHDPGQFVRIIASTRKGHG